MQSLVIAFPSARAAACLVAGIPAAVRAAVQALAEDRGESVSCIVVTPGPWEPSAHCRAQWARLVPGAVCRTAQEGWQPQGGAPVLDGVALVLAAAHIEMPAAARGGAEPLAALRAAGAALLAATAKPGDGIVSRHLNRPVSQAISRQLLKIPGITPNHASVGTALLGLAMAACLLLGGERGLMAGALLFQAASIFDGVDGEIARATFQTSPRGAMIDSLIDAATNLAFIGGVTVNLALAGHSGAAMAGAAGLVMLASGLAAIGMRSARQGGAFTFDAVKHHAARRPSRLMQWLTWLTMRDFFAALAAVLILCGLAPHALVGFAVCTALWLAYTLTVLGATRKAA
ncbi:CDP-alcohol phosphatidyltransferase family protein [Novosphingobium clariflavum]|uniref:CDP-alcohol phosphatidyltransferase family protein n=1 Tax=Novosphingobium clariflavum TaxID=2029884 RepID=A0ABV6S6W3_9SPHN|nr:CDP-alcohol phosphatidyltransferase family protein [Novosphingobium clariflavum]